MSKRRDTRRWLQKHRRDPYVRAARAAGYRSRAAYKLAAIDAKDALLANKRCIIDLGAAPGGWSQYCRRAAPEARIIALDRLSMDPLYEVEFLPLDFATQSGLDGLKDALEGDRADLVLSDMAPNLKGIKAADQAATMQLAELVLALCGEVLTAGGDALIKVFQGEGFDDILVGMRRAFDRAQVRKPQASRATSREMYLLGRDWRK